jgi:uncharacterized protein (UPF0262 family)
LNGLIKKAKETDNVNTEANIKRLKKKNQELEKKVEEMKEKEEELAKRHEDENHEWRMKILKLNEKNILSEKIDDEASKKMRKRLKAEKDNIFKIIKKGKKSTKVTKQIKYLKNIQSILQDILEKA